MKSEREWKSDSEKERKGDKRNGERARQIKRAREEDRYIERKETGTGRKKDR